MLKAKLVGSSSCVCPSLVESFGLSAKGARAGVLSWNLPTFTWETALWCDAAELSEAGPHIPYALVMPTTHAHRKAITS
jgi:hypothetical protein